MGFGNEQVLNYIDTLPGTTLINYYKWSMQRCFQQLSMQGGWKNSSIKELLAGKLAMHGCDVKFIHNKLFLSTTSPKIHPFITSFKKIDSFNVKNKKDFLLKKKRWTQNGVFLPLRHMRQDLLSFKSCWKRLTAVPNANAPLQSWLKAVKMATFSGLAHAVWRCCNHW